MKISLGLLKSVGILFCSIFTVVTVTSCIINLLMWNENETYIHILDRAILTLVGSIIVSIAVTINFKSLILNCFIPYLIFILLAFLYVFISGFFVELHPNAYRDIFINDTIAYIMVYVGILIYKNISKRKKIE